MIENENEMPNEQQEEEAKVEKEKVSVIEDVPATIEDLAEDKIIDIVEVDIDERDITEKDIAKDIEDEDKGEIKDLPPEISPLPPDITEGIIRYLIL